MTYDGDQQQQQDQLRGRQRGQGQEQGQGQQQQGLQSVNVSYSPKRGLDVLTQGAVASFTAIMAVGTASTKSSGHRHALRPAAGPTSTMCACLKVYLTSNLAKLCL